MLRAVAFLAVVLGALLAAPVPAEAASTSTSASPGSVRSFTVPVAESPGSSARIPIDVSLYTPAVTPAPAVLLAHGFGQSKADLAPEARRLQGEGYVVLAYSARGFGSSGGSISLDSLDAEVPDARSLVDVLARDPAVEQQRGDPVVGVVGGSYGGALALMLGATDPRIDTVVAAITWNDLADALDPRVASGVRDFKTAWAARLFAAGAGSGSNPCGRFSAAFCALYGRLVAGGQPTSADLALLARSSPDTVLARLHAPTLLLQGIEDSLFGLDQADATARTLRAAGTPVQVRWFDGGHDGGGIGGTDEVVDRWLAAHLQHRTATARSFIYAVPPSATSFAETLTAPAYAGLDGDERASVALSGGPRTIVNPPGGQPQAVTGIPGVAPDSREGQALGRLSAATDPASGRAVFTSAPLAAPALLAGTASVRVRVAAAAPSTAASALLYAQLSVRTGSGETALPGGVAPVRLATDGTVATVRLPATVWRFAPGDRIVLTLRTTDSQFAGSATAAADRVSLTSPLTLPAVRTVAADRSAGLPSPWVLAGIAAALLAALALIALALIRSRRRPGAAVPDDGPPLSISGLTKRFRSGSLAVDEAAFTVRRGQVLGLLGENGAGKTTTLRMVAGLLRPDAGTIEVFGVPVVPGSAVLTRLGCFIEGPGFLPHLSGRRNLELYWAATGRPRAEARFDEALAVADLGAAVAKPVRGYSQGMRQRLAIAQAMLGMPDLLVLDEPTNGLDPPQITALRGVLRRYAESGRTVVVSSHLLGEVQRTCSHVVVMTHGRVVAAGPVAEVAHGGDLEAAFLELIGATEPSA